MVVIWVWYNPHSFRDHGQQKKLKKLFNARSNLESQLLNIHKDITEAIDRQDRRVKVERLVSMLKDAFSKLMQKNEEQIDLASKAENPDSDYSCP